MSKLSAFIKPVYRERTVELDLGDRFVDENGEHVKVVMKSLTQEQLNAIVKQSTREKKVGDSVVTELDPIEHLNRCLIASITFPDLTSKEICDACHTIDPVTVPPKLFLVDEYEILAAAFGKLNGLKEKDGPLRIPGEISKN